MNICLKCVLPETFPGIRFDRDGVCNYCRHSETQSTISGADREKYRSKFDHFLKQRKQEYKAPYDVIIAYSGGKDSSYTLKLLKEKYGLSVLAITFNHGFVSPQALTNIQRVTQTLNVSHLMVSPKREALIHAFRRSISEELYPLKALERASSICNTCMHLVKSFILKTAIEMRIPFMVYGWSPGQAPVQSSMIRLNISMIRQTQDAVRDILLPVMGEELQSFILQERHYRLLEQESSGRPLFFFNVNPLAFLPYDEQSVIEEIRTLGWEKPKDTDANSTNCLLNGFANETHLERHRFHPYAREIAGLVRAGCMKREEGLAKLSERPDETVRAQVREQLGL